MTVTLADARARCDRPRDRRGGVLQPSAPGRPLAIGARPPGPRLRDRAHLRRAPRPAAPRSGDRGPRLPALVPDGRPRREPAPPRRVPAARGGHATARGGQRDGRPRRRAQPRLRERGPAADRGRSSAGARRRHRRRRRGPDRPRPVGGPRAADPRRRRRGGRPPRPWPRRASLCVRATGDLDDLRARLEADGHRVELAPVDPSCLLLPDGADPSTLPGYDEGAFAVQDQASAAVAGLVAAGPGDRVADVCAAPGGKSFALDAGVGPDGTVVAADLGEGRLVAMWREADPAGRAAAAGPARRSRAGAARRRLRRRSGRRPVFGDRLGPSTSRAPVARRGIRGPDPRGEAARDRRRVRRPRATGRPPGLRGVHLPAGGDRRGAPTCCSSAVATCDRCAPRARGAPANGTGSGRTRTARTACSSRCSSARRRSSDAGAGRMAAGTIRPDGQALGLDPRGGLLPARGGGPGDRAVRRGRSTST